MNLGNTTFMKNKLYVKEICKEKGLTLKNLAEKLKVTPSNLSQTLQANNPGVSTLENIADALGVKFINLFSDPSQGLIDTNLIHFRNDVAKSLLASMSAKDGGKSKNDDKLAKKAIDRANALINAARESTMDIYDDFNFKFAVFMYCNNEVNSFIGVFSSYDKALDAALEDAKFITDEVEIDGKYPYVTCNVNRDYCFENLDKPEDVIFADGVVLVTVDSECPELDKKDRNVYKYEVRTFFVDEPMDTTVNDFYMTDNR